MQKIRLLLILLALQTFMTANTLSTKNISQQIHKTLTHHLKGKNKNIVLGIYQRVGYAPIWVNKNKEKTRQLLESLKNPLFNYKSKPFDITSIKQLFYALDNSNLSLSSQSSAYARLDVMLTNSFVRLVRFMVQGDVDWKLVQEKLSALKESDDISAKWEMKMKSMPNSSSLLNVISNKNINTYLSTLIPMEKRYKKLINLLLKYKNITSFPKISYSHKLLKLGSASKRIANIKQRLQLTGDYPRNITIDRFFDKHLERAIINIQKRYLITVTGMIDKTTTYYLNKPLSEHLQAIVTNLDKTKLYPKYFEKEYIEVNIPDFNLRYYKNNKQIDKIGLIVGRIDRPTPLFDSKIKYMVLNPTWTIPNNLIKRDLIGVLKENPYYMQENNIHAYKGNIEIDVNYAMLKAYENNKKRVPYRFVQLPSDKNALGRVKFMFPNKYAVYLHDTDDHSLFDRRYKIYSSGCMRVEKPFRLMHTLLKNSRGYSANRLENIFRTNKPTTVHLNSSVPVHMLYFTVYVENGLGYFKHDIYLYDKIIEESTLGRKKSTFKIPTKRMISIKKKENKPLSN